MPKDKPLPHVLVRIASGHTQAEVAEAVGVSLPTWKRMEKRSPEKLPYEVLEKFASFVKKPIHVVVGRPYKCCKGAKHGRLA